MDGDLRCTFAIMDYGSIEYTQSSAVVSLVNGEGKNLRVSYRLLTSTGRFSLRGWSMIESIRIFIRVCVRVH